jgi:hypothetical protein
VWLRLRHGAGLHPGQWRQQPRGRRRRPLRSGRLGSRGLGHFSGVSGDEGTSIEAAEFDPIEIPAGGLVNLAEPPADIVLTGDFTAGDVVPLAIDFGNGERIMLNVPVVSDDTGYWEGMDAS